MYICMYVWAACAVALGNNVMYGMLRISNKIARSTALDDVQCTVKEFGFSFNTVHPQCVSSVCVCARWNRVSVRMAKFLSCSVRTKNCAV